MLDRGGAEEDRSAGSWSTLIQMVQGDHRQSYWDHCCTSDQGTRSGGCARGT